MKRCDSMVETASWRRIQIVGDDESYMENHRYTIECSEPRPRSNLPLPANPTSTRNPESREPSLSFSTQQSEMDTSSRGIEARSDPSVVLRINSTCEREDVDDDEGGSRADSNSAGSRSNEILEFQQESSSIFQR